MTDLPEHDPELTPVLRTARRFLEWLAPSPDDPARPMSNERVDDLPQLHSSHVFVAMDDAVIDLKPRNDLALTKVVVGTFDDLGKKLAETNIRARVGIFVQVDAQQAFVAEFGGAMARHGRGARIDMRESLPLQPSVTIHSGRTGGFVTEQWVWLLSEPLSVEAWGAVARKLDDHGAVAVKGSKILLRVPGFFNRSGAPFQVQCQGLAEYCGLRSARYTPEALVQGFLPRPIEAA